MAYTMKGSPAKLGTIQGTTGHASALKMASAAKHKAKPHTAHDKLDDPDNISKINRSIRNAETNVKNWGKRGHVSGDTEGAIAKEQKFIKNLNRSLEVINKKSSKKEKSPLEQKEAITAQTHEEGRSLGRKVWDSATQIGMGIKGKLKGKSFKKEFAKEKRADERAGAKRKTPPKKSSSGGSKEFNAAFSAARKAGKKTFDFKGKSYHTRQK